MTTKMVELTEAGAKALSDDTQDMPDEIRLYLEVIACASVPAGSAARRPTPFATN